MFLFFDLSHGRLSIMVFIYFRTGDVGLVYNSVFIMLFHAVVCKLELHVCKYESSNEIIVFEIFFLTK